MYDNFGANLLPLDKVLSRKCTYRVPAYQRRYRWDVERVERLWGDVVETYLDGDRKDVERLLGSIVIMVKDGTSDIVDGQQRLISLTLLYCAIRDSLNKQKGDGDGFQSNLDNLVQDIEKRVIYNNSPFITLNDTDDDLLFRTICDGKYSPRTGSRRASGQLRKNYNKLCGFADKLCTKLNPKNNDQGRRQLEYIIDAMTTNVYIIVATAKNENDALQIFQALNTSGQALTNADLIKSYLIQKSKDLEKLWTGAFTFHEKQINKKPERADRLIYESMLSRNPGDKTIAMRDLYDRVIEKVTNVKTAQTFVRDLRTDTEIINNLDNPPANDPRLTHLLYGLNQVNAVYFRRPIIAAVREWGVADKRFPQLLSCLLKFFFMYRTVCRMDIDQLRGLARDLTRIIIREPNVAISHIRKIILKVVEQVDANGDANTRLFHERFELDFLSQKYNNAVLKYIFISIERDLQREFEVQAGGLDVEHIFPQKASKEIWPNSEELSQFRNNIANLTLLPSGWNKALQNYDYITKKTGKKRNGDTITLRGKKGIDAKGNKIVVSYDRSCLKLNEYFHSIDKWDRNEIINRQESLLVSAKNIWNLKGYENSNM